MQASSAVRGVAAIAAGSIGGQAIVLAAAPVLSRLYSPSDFGIFTYLMAVCGLVVTVASLRFEAAIPLLADKKAARSLTRLALMVSTASAAAVSIVAYMNSARMAEAAGERLDSSLLFLGPLIALTSWFAILSQGALRSADYNAVASRTALQNAGSASAQLMLGALWSSAAGLLTGQLVGRALGIASLGRRNRELLLGPTYPVRQTVKEHWQYPLIFAPSALLNALGTNLPVLAVTAMFGASAAGQLGLAQRVVMAPAAIIGASVAQVYVGQLSGRLRQGNTDTRALYGSVSRRLLMFAIAISAMILVGSNWLFPIVFGEDWAQAGELAAASAISIGCGFVAGPLSFVFIAYGKRSLSLAVDSSRLLLVGGAAAAAYSLQWDLVTSVWAMFGAQAINYIITWTIGRRISTGK